MAKRRRKGKSKRKGNDRKRSKRRSRPSAKKVSRKSKLRGNDRKRQKKQRKKLLARVTRDNKVTRKERKKLQKAGISSNKARNYQINKSRPKTNSRRKARQPASVAAERIYTPLKIKGSGSWDSKKKSSSSSRKKSSSSSGAPRDTGKFVDIRNAIRENSAAGQSAANDIRNLAINQPSTSSSGSGSSGGGDSGGGDSGSNYDAMIAELMAQTAASEAAYEQQLAQQAEASAASLANLNDLFAGQMEGVETRMAQQQDQFNTAQAFANEQWAAANNALLAEQRRSANMANAFVPQANPTASSIGYGDGRRAERRKKQDNQLSDLTLLSGLGTVKSPLAGLQLA